MKNAFTLLALAASTALAADSCNNPCEPCCVPQPKPPVCCECYVPSFNDMQCDWGLFVSADFLYWYADETDLTYAAVTQTGLRATPVALGSSFVTPAGAQDSPFISTIDKVKHFNAKWAPGVRVGLGWRMDGGWDLYANWTYYTNDKKHSLSTEPFTTFFPTQGNKGILNPWVDQGVFPYPERQIMFDSLSAKWNLVFNQVDLELGRRYWLSKCFTMRPYAGLRGAWANTRFRVSAHQDLNQVVVGLDNLPAGTYITDSTDSFRNRNWGVGFIGGLQPTFYFTEEFSLYANVEGSLLWGQLNGHVRRNYTGTFTTTAGVGPTDLIDYAGKTGDKFSGMQPVMDLGVGLRWETCWCDNRYRFNLDAGWEHHVFFNYNHRVQLFQGQVFNDTVVPGASNGRGSTTYQEVDTNLGMGGFILRARLDF